MRLAFDPDFKGSLLLSALPLIVFLVIYMVKRKDFFKYAFMGLFAAYIVFVLLQTVPPIHFGASDIRESFASIGWKLTDCIKLIPFADGITKDDLLNVLMTVPFGFLLPLVKKRVNFVAALTAGLAFSLMIELLQLLLAALRGFAFRYFDTADIICNLLGAVIGWLIIEGIITLVQRSRNNARKTGSLLAYLESRQTK